MKLQVVLLAAATLAAGPAMAETAGSTHPRCSWTTGGCPQARAAAKPRSYGVPQPTPAPAYRGPTTSKIYGAPEPPKPETFKPYKPYTGGSVYSQPSRQRPPGARPCETSVYVNACGEGR